MTEELDPNFIECPKCPVCGKQTDTFYRRKDFVIVGCPECVSYVDSWDTEPKKWKPLEW